MLDWQVGDDTPLSTEPETPGNPTRRRLWRWLGALLIVLLLLALVGAGLVWRTARLRQERLLADAQVAVDNTVTALLAGDPAISPWDPDADRLWQTRYVAYMRGWARAVHPTRVTGRVLSVDLVAPDLAVVMVEMHVFQSEGENISQQAQVYRLADAQWQRTSADERAWGPWEVYETHRFRFVYHQRDAALARALAQGADEFFDRVYTDLAVQPPGPGRLNVTLDTIALQDSTQLPDGFRLASPLLSFNGVDNDTSATDMVRWNMASSLVSQVAHMAFTYPLQRWGNVISSMLDAEASTFAPIPVARREKVMAELQRELSSNRLVPLSVLSVTTVDPALADAEWASLGDFALDRLGPDGPARVIAATQQARSWTQTWDELAGSAFGLSAAELDTAWRTWLRMKIRG